MGLHLFGSSSSYDSTPTCNCTCKSTPKLPNPDPRNYKVKKSLKVGKFLVVMVHYPDCTNYEGLKIMLYKDVSVEELIDQKTLDHHFAENKKFHSPIARFEPTREGWLMAVWFAENCPMK